MLRITRGEESKLTSWYFEIDRTLLTCVLVLILIGLITLVTAGAADATRMGKEWYFFIRKALGPYSLGLLCLFGFSVLNKKQIKNISVIGVIACVFGLLLTSFHNPMQIIKNGSHRWINVGVEIMPSDLLKPFFIVVTAWFLATMRKKYGSDIFMNKEAWNFKQLSWAPYLLVFTICLLIMILQPDLGSTLLYIGILGVMVLVAGFPVKFLPWIISGLVSVGAIAIGFLPQLAHVRDRIGNIFHLQRETQVWYSVNSIRHGGLFGVGTNAYVQDALPESTNDFVYAAISEVWGAIGGCALLLLFLFILNNLIKHAMQAKDDFVMYAITGIIAVFGGQICFNLMTALHLLMNKGMTLPFISYGGWSFITFCIIFGIALALIREDTWNR